ncbi:MAG: molybdopterin-binding oxidoreductase [Bryobacterales bacterium]|nr:molybdopterin-binding oxidoreductase [Bryobacterales bacterium]
MIDREIVLSPDEAKAELRKRTRRGFLIGGVAAIASVGAYEWMKSREDEDGIPHLERRVLDANGKLAHRYLDDRHVMPTFSRADIRPLKPNGNIGIDHPVESDWRLTVNTGHGPELNLGVADVKSLPKVNMITRFCCIEGWDTVVQWGGARFSDFTSKYFPPGPGLPPYVSMMTPDEEYFVGLDLKSALHPQTLLAYEYNGSPLTPEHGAPLRLVIPVKYGIKNIKRIGTIQYTAKRPEDYWAEDGYDWFAGL